MSDIKISDMQPWVGAVGGNVEFPAIFGNENYRIALSQLTTSTFGFGSMALQNSNAVSITGGSVAVTALSGAITIANGGTGLGTAPGAGQLLIGTGTQYSLSTLTAGSGIAITNAAGAITIAATGGGGTVTSVDVSGGSTGLTFSGGPVTSSGTITAGGTLASANGGTGQSSYTNGQMLIGKTDGSLAKTTLTAGTGIGVSNGDGSITVTNSAPDQTVVLTGGTGISTSGTYPSFTITNSAPDQVVGLSAGTGISVSGSYPSFTVTNSAPDQVVSLTGAGTTSISGTYPNFTITSNDQFVGTVTSVAASGGTTGLTFSGSPVTTTGTLTLSGTLAIANGGTGQTSYTGGQLLIGKTDGTLAKATLTAGTGISVSNGDGSVTVTNSAPDQTVVLTAGSGISVTGTYPSFTLAATSGGGGTVTSVDASGGTTGLTFSGGPITTSGTLTLSGTLAIANGGTGATTDSAARTNLGATTVGSNFFTLTNPSAIRFTRINADNTVSALSDTDFRTAIGAGTGNGTVTSVGMTVPAFLSVSGSPVTSSGTLAVSYSGTALPVANGGTGQTSFTDGQLLIGNTTGNTLTKAALTAGSGISITNGAGAITISSTLAGGTVTSVDVSGGTTGITFSGGPVTSSGTITMAGTLAVANGGTGATTDSTARTNLGATTVGGNLFTLTNPSAVRFLRVNADNTVSALSDTDFRTAIGAGTGSGTVTSVGGAGTVNGITLTGTVTSSGSLTLGGTLSNVSLTTQVTGTLPVANGGTGATDAATARTNLGAGTVTSVGGTGTVNGLTLTGTVTGSGNLTLGGTLSGVSLASQVTGTLPVANGGTGATTLTGVVIGNGTSAFTVKTNPTGDFVGTTDTQTLTNKTLTSYTETVFAVVDAAGAVLDPNNGPIQTWTLGASRTPTQANWAAGQSITLMIDDGSAFTVTWTTLAVVWETNGGVAPTLATTGFTVIVLWKVGTTIYGARVGDA